jgi:Integrase zinc binding domain
MVPKVYKKDILLLAHDSPMSENLGVSKTLERIREHFYWPHIRQDVVEHCRTCKACQLSGKPNQNILKATLQPIPVLHKPFAKVVIDCVGSLPKTKSGNECLLTLMCTSTRFPEVIPLRNIRSKTVDKAMVKFFTTFGLPNIILSYTL